MGWNVDFTGHHRAVSLHLRTAAAEQAASNWDRLRAAGGRLGMLSEVLAVAPELPSSLCTCRCQA